MDTKTPFVSDEQIRSVPMHDIDTGELVALEEMSPYRVRDLYEAELQALRDRVEPRDRIIQELVDAIMDNARHRLLAEGEEGDTVNDFLNMTLNTALAKAKEQFGVEPSNQK